MLTSFREAVRKVSDTPAGLWWLARWGKQRAQPMGVPQFPPLKDPRSSTMCTTTGEKVEILRGVFFPQPLATDLEDIPGWCYPTSLEECPSISPEELHHAIFKPAQDKAPGPDGIPHWILRLLFKEMEAPLRSLFNACLEIGHHPHCFHEATTIVLRKPDKPDYTELKAWHPIALLNTLGKALEAIVVGRIWYIAEKYQLLPRAQYGCRRQRDMTTALELLTKQIHTVWGQGRDKVATLLSLDVSGAFPNVSHDRLLHNLRKKGVPTPLVQWTTSFLTERKTSLVLGQWQSEMYRVTTGIPQGSPISPILFLFFNMELVELCARSPLKISGLGFMDDVNILTYGKTMEGNCWVLEHTHQECEVWASRHGATFALSKYELMHLTRSPKQFNMVASIWLLGGVKDPTTTVRVLRVLLDSKLRWGPHIQQTQNWATQQCKALTALSASTWEASFAQARLVYSAVV